MPRAVCGSSQAVGNRLLTGKRVDGSPRPAGHPVRKRRGTVDELLGGLGGFRFRSVAIPWGAARKRLRRAADEITPQKIVVLRFPGKGFRPDLA